MKLIVKKSNIKNAGKGLFWNSHSTLKKNTILPIYNGKRLTLQQVNKKYGKELAEYTLCSGNSCIDAIHSKSLGRYANDCKKSPYKCNSRYLYLPKHKSFALVPTRDIHKNEELLVNYGNKYWK